MLLHLKHLLLEATRKCNMACPHCMRGDAEELSMDYAVIDRIFEDVRQIDHLVLTGGEPSLAPYVIQQILYRARVWKCSIHSFFSRLPMLCAGYMITANIRSTARLPPQSTHITSRQTRP